MGNGLLAFGIGALVIAGFFMQSIYRALAVNKNYWLVVLLHLICAALFIRFFMI
jgi:hypothetical protein